MKKPPSEIRFILTVVVVSVFMVMFIVTVFAFFAAQSTYIQNLSQRDIQSIDETLLFVNATLFGLSALSGGIFLVMLSRQEFYSMLLNSNMLYFMTSSYILFIIGLIDGFLCLFNPGVTALIVSAACTVGGSINGSSSLVLAFRDYLFKSKNND